MDRTEYNNPIKDKPVRQAGQSAREKGQNLNQGYTILSISEVF